jgi:hypothetical protein
MTQVILDIAANTHLNSESKMVELMECIPHTDKYEIVLKTQFWSENNPQGDNLRCTEFALRNFRRIAREFGFKSTSSVFDLYSLRELICLSECGDDPIPFVKIACRPELRSLIDEIPRKFHVIASFDPRNESYLKVPSYRCTPMRCVPEYPATLEGYQTFMEYDQEATIKRRQKAGSCTECCYKRSYYRTPPRWMKIQSMSWSDHTCGLELWNWIEGGDIKHFECHYVLEHSDDNPDAGPFAKTPDDLCEMFA